MSFFCSVLFPFKQTSAIATLFYVCNILFFLPLTLPERCWLGETNFDYDYTKFNATPNAIAIQINGNDHYVLNTIVFSSMIGLEVRTEETGCPFLLLCSKIATERWVLYRRRSAVQCTC